MKTIGLIGGMSWESTVTYYQMLNRLTREKLGGLHSAKLLLWSFDFADIEADQTNGDWSAATQKMTDAAKRLQRGGSDCIVICTNTMHKMAEDVEACLDIPLIHIADATASAILESRCKQPLLLATAYTMEQDFYKGRLFQKYGIEVCIPDQSGRKTVHDIIYNELCQGIVRNESKRQYLDVISQSVSMGADSVILGCTEIGLLLSGQDTDLPVFDTTELHARSALAFALEEMQ